MTLTTESLWSTKPIWMGSLTASPTWMKWRM